jgi:hypothetical protein
MCMLLLCVRPSTADAASTGLIQVDGRTYSLDVDENVAYDARGRIMTIPTTSMSNCHRPSGAPPAISQMGVIYGEDFGVLYTGVPLVLSLTAPQIRISTPTGDVICDGQVTAPAPPLFANNFE